MMEKLFVQTLIVHVITDYMLAHNALFSKSCYWNWNSESILNLCYTKSPTQGVLIGIVEGVGIITGQSIGELETQLSLATFHSVEYSLGSTADLCTPSNENKTEFNENLVHPTCSNHRKPSFLCYIDLHVTTHG